MRLVMMVWSGKAAAFHKTKAPIAATVGTTTEELGTFSTSIIAHGLHEDKPLTLAQEMEWLGIDIRRLACAFVDKGVA